MSRSIASGLLVLTVALLSACPKAEPTTAPSVKPPPLDDARVRKLATILRAADRRIVEKLAQLVQFPLAPEHGRQGNGQGGRTPGKPR